MAFLDYLIILFLFFTSVPIIIFTYKHRNQVTSIPRNWPILGMIPGVLVNAHRIHDYATNVLIESHGTFRFNGPWFANVDLLLTTDPLDINHILSKNFSNYPKGDKFQKIFDVLGDGILNSDGKIWEMNRKLIFSIFKGEGFQSMVERIIWDKVENGVLPVLESFCEHGSEIDLQDVFQRFAFDTVCKLLFDNDPVSLSLDFPYIPCLKAFQYFEEAILLRPVTPAFLWKLQQNLRVGKEKKMGDALKSLDEFIKKCLDKKLKEYNNKPEVECLCIFTLIMRELKDQSGICGDKTKFLRDMFVNLMVAGKDSISSALSWFFYLLATNPTVEDKILEVIQKQMEVNERKKCKTEDLDKMVYLHGALLESLRLYPPVPFNRKSLINPDTLPSGHRIHKNTNIIISVYSMGRMKSIWGADCMKYKPERWISNSGGIKHEPSYKFPAFHAGPRACLGKTMALSQLKIVASLIIRHYHIELVKGHLVLPTNSVILHMKHGLRVKLTKRSDQFK